MFVLYKRSRWLLVFLAVTVLLSPAWSEDQVSAEFGQASSAEQLLKQVKESRDQTEQRSDLGDVEKTALLESYNDAERALESALSYREKERSYQKLIESGSSEVQDLENETRALLKSGDAGYTLPQNLSLPEAEQELIRVQSEHAALESRLVEIDRALDELKTRPAKTRDQLTAARKILLELGNELVVVPGTSEPERLQRAHGTRLQAQRMARENEIKMLEQELLSYPAQTSLRMAERELTQQRLVLSSRQLRDTEDFVNERGEIEARLAQEETAKAEEEASGKHPEILRVAAENAQLSEELVILNEELTATREAQEKHEQTAKLIEQDFRSSKQRLEVAGLSDASGQYMSNERQKLPDLRQYRKGEKRLHKSIRKAGIAQLHLDEQLRELENIENRVEQIIAEKVDGQLPDSEKAEIRSELTVLLTDQEELLRRGSENYTNYLRALNTLDFTHKRLVETSNQYRDFIDEHLLWIPSAEPVNRTTLTNLVAALGWAMSPENWRRTGKIFLNEIISTPWLTAIFILIFGGLLALGQPLRAAVKRMAVRLQSPYSDRFIFTLQALVLTLLIALPLPFLFAFIGWQLGLAEEYFEFSKSVSSGLIKMATPLFLLQIFLNLCKKQGVAAKHLHWDAHLVAILRKNLFWLTIVVTPLIFLATLTKAGGNGDYYSSLGRISLLLITATQSIFVYFVLHPVRGVPKNLLAKNPTGWLMTLRYVWFPFMILWPLFVAAVALIGYQYTAVRLMELLMATFWLVLGMKILHDIIFRWLTVSNRKLALIMAREKREAAKSAEKTKILGEAVPELKDVPEVQFSELSEQTRALLLLLFQIVTGIGFLIIWSEVIPALAILEDVTLWQTTTQVGSEHVIHAVTLASLAAAILLGVVVVAAAKNLPGVMEMIVLRHIRLERGSRYAIMTITRYIILFVGFLVIFNTIGGRWSEIQWLVAALGVGLGFGLQEIVANFISGIILLFERPIRIGDTVTVGDVTGVVSRIQIRATTITDMDRKELLVPNKQFITDQMINWSLSDPINRVVLPVGIAYGSNTQLAHQVMVDTIRALPIVLKEPKPSVYFVGFGDSSLDFEVRVFVKNYEDRFAAIHAVHMELEKALNQHDIEIPFPQRVVHIKET